MMYDPGRLARNLETLTKELADWSHAIKDTRETASFEQRQTAETVLQAEQRAKIIANQLAYDQEMIDKANEALKVAQNIYKEACDRARQTLAQVQAAHSQAIQAQSHWEAELEKARAWLQRAQARLERARIALQVAEADLRSAEYALSSAESALRSCNSSREERKSCAAEAAAVRAASARVARVRAEVAAAQREVQAAEQEVQQAKARVAACTQAVEFARQAVKLSQEAERTAQQGLNFAERSLEHLQAAYKALQEAIKALQWEEDEVNAMMADVRAATTSLDEAKQHQRAAEHYENAAQHASYRAQHDIEDKIQRLYDLNRPSLYDIGQIVGQRVVPFLGAAASILSLAANGAIIANHIHDVPTTATSEVRQEATVPQFKSFNGAAEAQRQRDEMLHDIADKSGEAANAARELYEEIEKNKQ